MTDTNYLIKGATLQSLANVARGITGTKEAMTPLDAIASLAPYGREPWTRPSDWPNLDEIDVSDFEGVYLTYDLRKTPDYSFIAFDCAAYATIYVERGHLENNIFVADESQEFSKRAVIRQELNPSDGDVQLWRIYSTGNMISFAFITNSSTAGQIYAMGWQPLVERKGRLIHTTSFAASTNCASTSASYGCQCSYWLEKDNMILGDATYSFKSSYMYDYALQEINLKTDDNKPVKVSNLQATFNSCYNLSSCDLSMFDTSECTTLSDCFGYCYSLKNFTLPVDTSSITTISGMFRSALSLINIDLSSMTLNNVTSISYLFTSCSNLKTVNFGQHTMSQLSAMYLVFDGCQCLESIDMSGIDLSEASISDIRSMFNSTYNLRTLLLPPTLTLAPSVNNANPTQIFNQSPVLTTFNGIASNNNLTFNSNLLTHQSLVNIINKLPTVTSSKTLTIGAGNTVKLTSEEIAIATNKGWTVA